MAADSIEHSFQRIRFWKDFVTEKLNTQSADFPEVKQEVEEEQCCIDISSAWISCGAVAAGDPLTDPLSLEADRAGGHTRVEHTALIPSGALAAIKLHTDTSILRGHRINRDTSNEARSTLRAEGITAEGTSQEANREMFSSTGSVKEHHNSRVTYRLVTDSTPSTEVQQAATAARSGLQSGLNPRPLDTTSGDVLAGSANERASHSDPRVALCPQSARCDDAPVVNDEQVEERQYCCAECGKMFRKLVFLKVHLRIHASEHPYRCEACDRVFATYAQWLSHSRVHTGERPYGCSFCEKAYEAKAKLANHERTHRGERPFGCRECESAFRSRERLARHLRVHRGERPFPCPVCGLAFRTGVNLRLHLRTHTGAPSHSRGLSNENRSAFACSVCGKSFKAKAKLTYHERTSCLLGVYTPLLELCNNRKTKLANT